MSKTILITGGATGIGRACVLKFLDEGYRVSFCDSDEHHAHELLALIKERGYEDRVFFKLCDVRNKDELVAWAQESDLVLGNICALFVNAGIHRSNTLLDISDEELKLMIDINLYGAIYTLQAVVPFLISNGSGSIVINDSDQFFIGKAHSFAYGLTKGALGQMTRSLSIDLGEHNIRVNAICGGTIRTPLADKALQRYANNVGITLEEAWAEENALFARGKAGTAEEFAEMVYFLTEKATFCTGGHYLIDGGLVAK